MSESLLLLAILGLGFMLWLLRADVKFLHRRIAELEERLGDAVILPEPETKTPPIVVAKTRRTAMVTTVPITAKAPSELPPANLPDPERPHK